jgi:hypothetical protein
MLGRGGGGWLNGLGQKRSLDVSHIISCTEMLRADFFLAFLKLFEEHWALLLVFSNHKPIAFLVGVRWGRMGKRIPHFLYLKYYFCLMTEFILTGNNTKIHKMRLSYYDDVRNVTCHRMKNIILELCNMTFFRQLVARSNLLFCRKTCQSLNVNRAFLHICNTFSQWVNSFVQFKIFGKNRITIFITVQYVWAGIWLVLLKA